jgi:hypothetical protein
MTSLLNFIKIYQLVQKLMGDRHTRQDGDLISLHFSFKKESRLTILFLHSMLNDLSHNQCCCCCCYYRWSSFTSTHKWCRICHKNSSLKPMWDFEVLTTGKYEDILHHVCSFIAVDTTFQRWVLPPSSGRWIHSFMEAVCTCETSVYYKNTITIKIIYKTGTDSTEN